MSEDSAEAELEGVDRDPGGAQYAQIEKVRSQAQRLYEMAWAFVATAVFGLGGFFAVIYYPVRTYQLGWDKYAPLWEVASAAFVGGVIGFGLSLPFCRFFQVQAGLVQVQLRMEENTRSASEGAARTAQNIRALTDATLTGEWRPVGEQSRPGE